MRTCTLNPSPYRCLIPYHTMSGLMSRDNHTERDYNIMLDKKNTWNSIMVTHGQCVEISGCNTWVAEVYNVRSFATCMELELSGCIIILLL